MSARSGAPRDDAEGTDSVEGTHPRAAVAVLCAAGIVVALMQTIIVPLIPDLPTMLNASPGNTNWALTITLLVGAAVTPISGRLGDMFGKRLVLILGMGCVTVGSAVCALSDALVPFIIGRGMQGLGFGTIALGISVMRDIVPPHRLASAVGTMSASLGVGGALGLPFAAAIAQHISWHALFWICAAAAALGALGIRFTVPESPTRTGGRFDAVGAVGLIVMLVCLLLPLSKGSEWGWGTPTVIALFVGFVVVTAAWLVFEHRATNSLIDLSVARRRPVMLTNVASFATGFAFYSMQLIPIQLLMAPTSRTPDGSPAGLDLDMLPASLVLAPSGIVMFLFSNLSGRIQATFGPRVSLALGSAAIGLGYIVFIAGEASSFTLTWWFMLIVGAIIGAGLGIAYSAMPALIMASVRVEQTGEANGVNALTRVVGTSSSAAIVGMILTASMVVVAGDGGVDVPVPTSGGYLWASAISLVACALACATALAIPRRTTIAEPEPVATR